MGVPVNRPIVRHLLREAQRLDWPVNWDYPGPKRSFGRTNVLIGRIIVEGLDAGVV